MSDPIGKIKAALAASGKDVSEDRIKEKLADPKFREKYFQQKGGKLGYKDYSQFEADLAPHVKAINTFDSAIPKDRPKAEDVPAPVLNKGKYQFEQDVKVQRAARTKAEEATKIETEAQKREKVKKGQIPFNDILNNTSKALFGDVPEKPIEFYEETYPEVSQNVRNLNQQIHELRGYREKLVAPLKEKGGQSGLENPAGQPFGSPGEAPQIDRQELQVVDADIAKMVDQVSRYKAENKDKLPIEHLTPRELLNKTESNYKGQIEEQWKMAEQIEALQRGENIPGRDEKGNFTLAVTGQKEAMKANPEGFRFMAETTTNGLYLSELGRAQSKLQANIADKYGYDIWDTLDKANEDPSTLNEKERYALTQLSQDPMYQRLADIGQTANKWAERTTKIIDKYPSIKEKQKYGEKVQRALDAVVADNPVIGSAGDFAKRFAKGVVLNSYKALTSNKFKESEEFLSSTLGVPTDGPFWATSTKYQKPFRTKVASFTDSEGKALDAHYNTEGQFVGTYDKKTGLLVSKIDPKLYNDKLETTTNFSSGVAMGTEVMGDLAVTVALTQGVTSIGKLFMATETAANAAQVAKFARFVGTPIASQMQYHQRWIQQGLQEGMTLDEATNYSMGVSGMIALIQPLYAVEARMGERFFGGMTKGMTPQMVRKTLTNPSTFLKKTATVLKEMGQETAEELLENVLEKYVANRITNNAYGTNLQTKYKDWDALKEDIYETAFVTAFATGPLSAVTQLGDHTIKSNQLRSYLLTAVGDINKYKTLIGELRSQGKLDNSKDYYEDILETIANKHADIFASTDYTEEAKKDIIINEMLSSQYAMEAAAAQDPESAVAKKVTEKYNEAQDNIASVIESKKGIAEKGYKASAKIAKDEQERVWQLQEEKAAEAEKAAKADAKEKAESNRKATVGLSVAEKIRRNVEGTSAPTPKATPDEDGNFEVPTSSKETPGTTKIDKKTFKKWKAADDKEKADAQAIRDNVSLNSDEKQKRLMGLAMKSAAEKRQILGTQTAKEKAKSESTIAKGEQVEVEGTTYSVVDPSVYGKVRIRNEDTGEETLVTRDSAVPQALLESKKPEVKSEAPSPAPTVAPPKAAPTVEFTGHSVSTPNKLSPLRKRAYNASRFLSKLGMPIKVVVHASEESFFKATGTTNASGVYLNGEIHLNEAAAVNQDELNTRGIHEAWHPVLEHIKVANPELYKQMTAFMYKEAAKNPYLKKKINKFVAKYQQANAAAEARGEELPFSKEDLEEEALTEFLTEVSENPNSLTLNGKRSLAKAILETFKKFSAYFIGVDKRNINDLKSQELVDIIQAASLAFSGDLSQVDTLEALITKAKLSDFTKRPADILKLRNWANIPVVEGMNPDELFGEGNWQESTINGQPSYVVTNIGIDAATKIAKDSGVDVITPDGTISQGKLIPFSGTPIINKETGLPTIKIGETSISLTPANAGFKKKMSLSDQTKTQEFKNWFGDSKVVDENGEPLVVYHGTRASEPFSIFDNTKIGSQTDEGFLGAGFYFTTDGNVAADFAGMGNKVPEIGVEITQDTKEAWTSRMRGNGHLGLFYLNLKNPLILKPEGWKWDKKSLISSALGLGKFEASKVTQALQSQGYDGVLLDYSGGGYKHKEVVVFDPAQIKSATGNIGTFDPNNPDIKYSLIAPHEKEIASYIGELAQYTSQEEKDAFVDDMADLFKVEPLEILSTLANQGLVWMYKGKRLKGTMRRGQLLNIPITVESFYTTSNTVEEGERMYQYADTVLTWGSPEAVDHLFEEVDEYDREPTTRRKAVFLLEGMLKVADLQGDPALQKRVMEKLSTLSTAGGQSLNAMRAVHQHNILPSLNGIISDTTIQAAIARGVPQSFIDMMSRTWKTDTAYTAEEVTSAQAAAVSAFEQRNKPESTTLLNKAASAIRSIFSGILGKASLLDTIVNGNGVQAVGDMMVKMVDDGNTGAQAVYATLRALQKVNEEAAASPRGAIFLDNEEILDFFRQAISSYAKGGKTRIGAYLNMSSPYKVDMSKLDQLLNYEVTAEKVLKELVNYVYSTNNAGGKRLSEMILGSPYFANYTEADARAIENVVASDMKKKYGERVKNDIARMIQEQVDKEYFGTEKINFQKQARSALDKITDAQAYGLLADDTMKSYVAALYLGDGDLIATIDRILELAAARAKTSSTVAHRKIDKEASWLAFKANPSATGRFFVNLFAYTINGLLSGVTTLYAATGASLLVTMPRIMARSTYMLGRSAIGALKGEEFISPFAFVADFLKSGQAKEMFKAIIPNTLRNDSRADHKQVFFGDTATDTIGAVRVQSGVDRALTNGIDDFYKAFNKAIQTPSFTTVGKAAASFLGTAMTFPLRVTSIIRVYEQAVATMAIPYLAYTEAITHGRTRGLTGEALIEYARKKTGFGNITAAHNAAGRQMVLMAAQPEFAHMFQTENGSIKMKDGLPVPKLRYKDLYGSLVQDKMLEQADNDFTALGEYIYKDMQMMGQPEGSKPATAFLNASKVLKPAILQSPSQTTTGKTWGAAALNAFGVALFPFARMIAQTMTVIYQYHVIGGIVAAGKHMAGNKSIYVGSKVAKTVPSQFLKPSKTGDPTYRLKSNAELWEQYIMVAGSAVAAFAYLFMSMFDWDDDEITLKEDRLWDVTFRLTGNNYENNLKDPGTPAVSWRTRDTPEDEWGEWKPWKYAMASIPMLAPIGYIRDAAVYGEGPVSSTDALMGMLVAPVGSMLEQTFAMTINTMNKAANEMTYKKKDEDELTSSVVAIWKTAILDILLRSQRTVLSGGNFSRDIYNDAFKATDPDGGYISSKVDNLPDEVAMALFKDSPVFEKLFIGEKMKIYDSFGNMIPREFKVKELAEMAAVGIIGSAPMPGLSTPFALSQFENIDLTPKDDAYMALPEIKLIKKYPRVEAPGKYKIPQDLQLPDGTYVRNFTETNQQEMQMQVATNMRDYVRENYDELDKISEKQLQPVLRLIFQEAAGLMKWQRGFLAADGAKSLMLSPRELLLKVEGQEMKEEFKESRTVEDQ